jgi:hypothetical protein
MAERRRETRRKSLLRGRIFFNNRRSAVDCLVRDISDIGARLIFSDAVSVPDIVDVYIPQKEQTMRAHVQWRHGDEVGVEFPDAAAAAGPAQPADGELSERIARLEAEVAALRKMLKSLKADIARAGSEAA